MGIERPKKLIDRIIFVCFAEDRGLLPDSIIQRVVASASGSMQNDPIWATFKSFFDAVDRGSERLGIPDGYNGGLFAKDRQLDDLAISDIVLRKIAHLSNYDFVEDLSVKNLGHIFEQSITDLEDIKQKVRASKGFLDDEAEEHQTLVSKRKQEGISTPDYVVRFIVENTLGAVLRAHEDECKREYGLSLRLGEEGYEQRQRSAYLKYQTILQNIKVLDPACGSGAFLVHVFDYLLAENKRVDDILQGSLTSTDEYVRKILHNNIYGVDLNEESVEITKLSLWLKTARKGKRLTALDDNIVVGNSIIDDPALAPGTAFAWQQRFPDVFSSGGFDVVVGNPPYGVRFSSSEKQYLLRRDPLVPDYEIYVYFISLVKQLVKTDGFLGYIFPQHISGKRPRDRVPEMVVLKLPRFRDARSLTRRDVY